MLNNQPIIWDCGAFGHRNLDIPQIRGTFVTAHFYIYQYARLSKPGDAIVAPDHLLTGNRINERRKLNWQQAIEFIIWLHRSCPIGCRWQSFTDSP